VVVEEVVVVVLREHLEKTKVKGRSKGRDMGTRTE